MGIVSAGLVPLMQESLTQGLVELAMHVLSTASVSDFVMAALQVNLGELACIEMFIILRCRSHPHQSSFAAPPGVGARLHVVMMPQPSHHPADIVGCWEVGA